MRACATALSSLALGAGLACPIGAGVVVEKIELDHWGTAPRETRTRIYAQGSKLRMVFTVDGEPSGEIIFRGDLWERWKIDHAKRTYEVTNPEGTRTTLEWMVAASSDPRDLSSELRAQLREGIRGGIQDMFGSEPHQRRMADALVEQELAALDRKAKGLAPHREETELRPTTDREAREGFAASRWEAWRADTKTADLWLVDLDEVPEVRELLAVRAQMRRFNQEIDAVVEQSGVDVSASRGCCDLVRGRLDGFTIGRSGYLAEELATEMRVLTISPQSLEPESFDPPPGYRRMEPSAAGPYSLAEPRD